MTILGREDLARRLEALNETVRFSDMTQAPLHRRWSLRALRIVIGLIMDMRSGFITLWAMSLVYTTLLSLVPLLAISFSILKGFGVHNQVEPLLLGLLEPLGEKGIEITEQIIAFVDNVKVGVLGSIGFAMLFYTVVSLMQKIERAFNFLWGVTRERSVGERFRDYLFVLTLGPALVFSAMGISATVMSHSLVGDIAAIQPLGWTLRLVGRLAPFAMIVAAFSFMYFYIPNTRVRPGAALTGGLIAGFLWYAVGWIFASVVVSSGNYTAIYSTFATLILLLIWLYVGWLILLVGARITFYVQNPVYLRLDPKARRLGPRASEKVALASMALLARNHYAGKPPLPTSTLAEYLGMASESLSEILDVLEDGGLIARVEGRQSPAYLPARPLEETTAADVIVVMRQGGAHQQRREQRLPAMAAVDRLIADAEAALGQALAGTTMKEIGQETTPPIAAIHPNNDNNSKNQ